VAKVKTTKATAKTSKPAKKAAKSKTVKSKAGSTASRSKAVKSTKPRAAKKKVAAKSVGDEEVVMDRRRGDRREEEIADGQQPPAERRQKVNRRRQIDPTTCERDYNNEEIEFMHALDAYKRAAGRMFPTCSEILEVVRELGYRRLTPEEIAKLDPPALASEDLGDANAEGIVDDAEADFETDEFGNTAVKSTVVPVFDAFEAEMSHEFES